MAMRWYVVHAYSGFEKSVQKALKERIERENMQDRFGKILVPVEEVVDMKNGKRSLTLRMVKNLHDGLNIPYESLLSTTPS